MVRAARVLEGFTYFSLDLFWLKDKSLEESDDLPAPDVLAQEIAADLQAAGKQNRLIRSAIRGRTATRTAT